MNRVVLSAIFLVSFHCGSAGSRCQEPKQAGDSGYPKKIASEHLPNPVQLHEKVISGGLPDGDVAFQELAQRGIKTIISVDGMKPDVELARKYGLRYVHLPHGYDGISESRVKELAKAVRDLEGPIYIHCHHGKHRSPAAASVACVAAGLLPPEQAIPILELAGTNPNYRGLYNAVRKVQAIKTNELDSLAVDFKEVQEVPAMAEAMVAIDHVHEQLSEIEGGQWKIPSEHPDLDAAHEALLLQELFTELIRQEETSTKPAEFIGMLQDSVEAARELHERLSQLKGRSAIEAERSGFTSLFTRIADNCKSCHVKYRDVPLDEKR